MKTSGRNLVGLPSDPPLEEKLDVAVVASQQSSTERYLVMVSGPDPGKIFALVGQEQFIGRAVEASVSVAAPTLSTVHARLSRQGEDWWIEDLRSANGTLVNDLSTSGPCKLHPGDVIQAGSIRFLFGAGASAGSLRSAEPVAPLAIVQVPGTGPILAGTAPLAAGARWSYAPALNEDDSLTLPQIIDRIRLVFTYVKRYGWLFIVCISVGTAAGVSHTRWKPPAGSASCQVALISEAKVNPMDQRAPQDAFFVAPEQTFTSLPTIMLTLSKLGLPASEEDAEEVQDNLTFHQQGYKSQLWRAEYLAPRAEQAAAFLEAHLQGYLQIEIEKTLQVIQAETHFLESELTEANKGLEKAETDVVQFRERYPHVAPSEVELAQEKEQPRFVGTAGPNRDAVQKELSLAREELQRGDFLLDDKVKEAKDYEVALSNVNTHLMELRAKGFGEQHPDVKKLKAQAAELRRVADSIVRTPSTELERQTNPEYRKRVARIDQLERELASAKPVVSESASTKPTEPEPQSLPQLEARYAELALKATAARGLRDTLSNKLKASELQLSLERASALARYTIVSPTRAEPPSLVKAALKRGLVGAVLGAIIAFCIALVLELRAAAARYRLSNG